ncbi:MAG: hypothetical protein MUD14_15115 [Hydrococcus sp. Prado102]|nr:hypothetical protein [Hydrococcus sp. Prado102]
MVQSSSLSGSLLQDLAKSLPKLRVQTYFKASLTALSHAMEDLVLEGDDQPLVIANFQQERFYRQEMQRYQRISRKTDQIYILAAPETAFTTSTVPYATIGLDPEDALAQEWHLVIVGDRYCAALICREYAAPVDANGLDSARQFRGFWTFDANVSRLAARTLLQRIEQYRPDLATSIEQARKRYQLQEVTASSASIDVQLFSDRLVTYLQAGQYRQVKDYLNLTQLNQQLAAIEQAQNNLIAIVGHELRTPLSTIQVCLESIATEPDMPEEFRQVMLDTALGDAERLRQLIQDFLLLSRLERGVMPWQVEPIDMGELISLAVSSIQGMRKETPMIYWQMPSEPLIVVCDGEALQQLLNRLIDTSSRTVSANAIAKFIYSSIYLHAFS